MTRHRRAVRVPCPPKRKPPWRRSLAGTRLFPDYVLCTPCGDCTLDIRIDDRMYPVNPGTLRNESRMLKFGVEVDAILQLIGKQPQHD